ncbi:MAG: hypothetical protein FWC23_08175 [Chitinispirillia bacterium]|nr:hypothetical protein [Chitinispirillia bacterium]MCL2269149.1 hypothetical protein [Chitinispirillia bacterium]
MKKSNILISAVCALFIAQSSLFAQRADNSPVISGNVNPSLKAPITLTAREANLSEVLRVLADRSGMNFVVGEGVTREKITIILNNTPLDESINLLVRASGLSYEIIGNSILIAEPDKLKEDVGLSSYVVELKYAKADEVAAALGDLSKNIKVDKGGNRLICFASPRVIMEIERLVIALDKPHTLVLLETRLIEVSQDKLNQYGLKWDQLSFATPGGIGTSFTVPEVSAKNTFDIGGATRGAFDMNVIIDLMVKNGDGRVLMDSKLTTTNNREASLHIGEVIPYAIQSYNLSTSGGMNQQIEKENVGVMLTMTPHINDDNQITLSLTPEVSNIIGWSAGDIPRIRTRKTSTTVRVENGQTVVLAGLLSEEKTTTVAKLPILGDIPVLGLLFQNKREEVKKSNLIIEVVPRIIHHPADIARYMNAPQGQRSFRGPRGGEYGPRGPRGEHRERGEHGERRHHRGESGRAASATASEVMVIEAEASSKEAASSAAPAPAVQAAQPAAAQPVQAPAATPATPVQPKPVAPAQPAPAAPAGR